MALATVLVLYLQKHSAMNGSQNRCDFSFAGPHLFFNLPCHCPEVQHELRARQEEDATQSPPPGMSGKRCLSGGGAGRRKCAGQPPPWHGGALVLLACDLAFLPLLRASYFAPAQPLCLPGARPSSRSRDTRDAGVMGSRRVNSDLTRSGSPKASALNKPFREQKSIPHHTLGNDLRPQT